MRTRWLVFLLSALLLAGCAFLQRTPPRSDSRAASSPSPSAVFSTGTALADLPPLHSPTAWPAASATRQATPATPDPSPNTPLSASASKTPGPSLRPASPTVSPTATRRPTLTRTPTATRRPTKTPTITLTPPIPEAGIQIYDPGPLSKITSPLHVNAWLKPGPSGKVRIELYGEDGALLVRQVISYSALSGLRISITADLDFEIAPGSSQLGRLQISTDDTYQRSVALASVDLLLLSVGETDLNPPAHLLEPIVIREPLPKILIQGGQVIVAGLVNPTSSGNLLIELIAADGQVVGYRQASITTSPGGDHVPYAINVPYTVQSPTWVRLTVKELSDRIPGAAVTALASLEVLLSP